MNEINNAAPESPALITYCRNLENRVLWLDSDVNDDWLEFSRKIIEWNREDLGINIEDRKPITLMFFSYGGSLDTGNSLIDTIKLSKTPVRGVNVGQSCSAACFVYLSCHTRFAFPNSTFLIHRGSNDGISGSYADVVASAMDYQRKIKDLEAYLKANTKIPYNVFEDKIKSEWYISAAEAVEYGMCDKIVESLDEIILY